MTRRKVWAKNEPWVPFAADGKRAFASDFGADGKPKVCDRPGWPKKPFRPDPK